MDRRGNTSGSRSAVTKVFALLVVICLVECATEQRINSRGSKSNLIEKVNGWRSQRGGSCLSYGHSCWGAHGKRSGKVAGSTPDWYLNRLLRRMAVSAEMNRMKQLNTKNSDIDAIYQLDMPDDAPANNKLIVDNDEAPIELPMSENLEGKPMLDDELISKMKLSQFMDMLKTAVIEMSEYYSRKMVDVLINISKRTLDVIIKHLSATAASIEKRINGSEINFNNTKNPNID